MIGGVFYREFTKFNDFSGITVLGKVHGHFFLLGMVVFLLVALFQERVDLKQQKLFRIFFVIYNLGVPLTGTMMFTGYHTGSWHRAFKGSRCFNCRDSRNWAHLNGFRNCPFIA